MKANVIIVLDAFRGDYITQDNTPFLFELSQKGTYIQRVHPSPGFCERNEILTGKHAVESGFFTAIGYDPGNSPYRKFRYLLSFLSVILPKSPDSFLNKFVRKLIGKLSKKFNVGMTSYRIPLGDLADYRLTEDQFPIQCIGLNDDSLLSYFSSNGKVFFDSFTSLRDRFSSTDDVRIIKALDSSSDISNSLYLVYVASADAVGHEFGPYSKEQEENTNRLDNQIEGFINNFKKKREDVIFTVIGDHGMAEVTEKVDVSSSIMNVSDEFGYRYGVDFTFFLDSTYCRLWIHNNDLSLDFIDKLKNISALSDFGVFIDKENYKKYGIPDVERLYGDYIWCANTGVLIWPDFFHNDISAPPAGMHGYLQNNNELLGFCIQTGKDVMKMKIDDMPLADIYKLVKKECND